jgi:hypothetical protein
MWKELGPNKQNNSKSLLCDLEKVAIPLWASMFSLRKEMLSLVSAQ